MNRKFSAGLAVIALVCAASAVSAQDYTNTLSSASAAAGGSFAIEARIANPGADLDGWSYGVCSGPEVEAQAIDSTGGVLNDGTTAFPPSAYGFLSEQLFPGAGWSQGVVIDLFGAVKLPQGQTNFLMATTTYSIPAGTAAGTYPIDYCDVLGTPPVANVVVVAGGSIAPASVSGSIEVIELPDPEFTYTAPTVAAQNYPSLDGLSGVSVTANFSIAETDLSGLGGVFPNDVQGFSMGVSNDPALVTPASVAPINQLAAINGGSGPAFFTVGLFADGWTVGVVNNLMGGVFLTLSEAGEELVSVQYDGVAGALAGVEGGSTTALAWDNTLGTPPVALVVVVDGASIPAATQDGSLSFNGTTTTAFERSDANGDGIINIADIVSLLSQLFQGVPIVCAISLDVNNDGTADAADAVYLASYIFQGGPPPPAPFGTCETVAGQTPEDCVTAGCTP